MSYQARASSHGSLGSTNKRRPIGRGEVLVFTRWRAGGCRGVAHPGPKPNQHSALGRDHHRRSGPPINVKPPPLNPGRHSRSITVPMAHRRLSHNEMHRLGPCLTALRVLAKSKGPHRDILVEKYIDEYLRTDPFSLAHALERLCRAIHYEELERRECEDWSVAKNYVRLLLHRMT